MKYYLIDTEMRSLEQITQTLIINGTLTECSGLFYGKTGIAVFFFHNAQCTANELFQNYALDLIEEVREQITTSLSLRYDVGLSGIGVAFEYFLQRGFLEADTNDIFGDFDARMYRAAMYEPYPNLTLQEGLTGWGRYFIYRVRRNKYKNSDLNDALTHIANNISSRITENVILEYEQPDVYRFFHDLTLLPEYANKYNNSLQQCIKWKSSSDPNTQKIFQYMNISQQLNVCKNYFNTNSPGEINNKSINNSIKNNGMLNGWSMAGLLHLQSKYNIDSSWLNLL